MYDQNPLRKKWLINALLRLDSDFPPICANEMPNLTLARRVQDGALLVFTLNLSYDDMDALRYICQPPLAAAEILDSNGTWRPLQITREGQTVKINHSLAGYACAVLRFR